MRRTLVALAVVLVIGIVAAFAASNGGRDQAFPVQGYGNGMTMRQWYKGMAISGLAGSDSPQRIAERAGQLADALVAEDARN